jgi:hypothetical protein
MHSQNCRNFASIPIPLNPSFLQAHGREETERAIRQIVRSVNFMLLDLESAACLLGPEMSYHFADPYLAHVLEKFTPGLTRDDILSYRSGSGLFDLSFEDSWSGYFIANQFQKNRRHDDLVLIHLDDHSDMMPTLLCRSGNALINPASGAIFNPLLPNDWESTIYSGVVSIGCRSELSFISRKSYLYDLIPGKQFAGISKSSFPTPSNTGTYLAGPDAREVLRGVPQGWTIVHIDLD